MAEEKIFDIENEIVLVLKNIYDPEIPVNIFDLGLIYEIDVKEDKSVDLTMTLTSPNCPVADSLVEEVHDEVQGIKGVEKVNVKLVFDPPWGKEMMTEEAMLELGML